ncbi:hypothetical protein LOD99_1661 [Oopsacas minuta]|uniref:Uncharacterized protein n=1 Tax=Oopsacas minuta TaxID=111878 RepID=A0AAV7K3U2_9METZ|nr:hypothetical protein LOD99_1661 [Oopsacas minuta]
MNFAKIRKAIVSRKDAKYFMYVPNNLYDDVSSVSRFTPNRRNCFSTEHTNSMACMMSELESNRMYQRAYESASHHYELMEDIGKTKGNASFYKSPLAKYKRKIKKSKKIEERIQSPTNYYPVKKTCENYGTEGFQNNDTLVPTFMSPRYIEQELYSYERRTGIDRLERVTDMRGNYYYILDF